MATQSSATIRVALGEVVPSAEPTAQGEDVTTGLPLVPSSGVGSRETAEQRWGRLADFSSSGSREVTQSDVISAGWNENSQGAINYHIEQNRQGIQGHPGAMGAKQATCVFSAHLRHG